MLAESVVLLVASLLCFAGAYDESSSKKFTCTLPEFPEHGSYVPALLSDLKSLNVYKGFRLNVTCDEGYGLVGESKVMCLAGRWFESMPECLPICKEAEHPNVLSCGVQEEGQHRCVLEQALITQVTNRRGDDDIENLECGRQEIGTVFVVSGGHHVEGHELPWHAGIYTTTTRPYKQICGGTLVSNTAVISAAHCFWDKGRLSGSTEFMVALGKLYRPWSDKEDQQYAQYSSIKELIVPPRFQGRVTHFQDDIAVLILNNPVTYSAQLEPICLNFNYEFDSQQLTPGALGKVGGWGLDSEDGKPSQVLKVADLPYVDVETCVAEMAESFRPYITSDKICAGYRNGTAVCKGDSGGGLVFARDGRYYLRGIVSAAPVSDHLCNVYSWATFTHVLKHEHFLKTAIGMTENNKNKKKQ